MEKEAEYDHLIQLTLSGNQAAYGELYDKTIEAVYKTVHFLLEEKSDVDDVVQEIYMQLYQSLSQFDQERPFRPWLMGLAVRQIHSYRRRRWIRLRIVKRRKNRRNQLNLIFQMTL